MADNALPTEQAQWVVWSGSSGLLAMATIGRIEIGAAGSTAWLERPFDMVGPFCLDELVSRGRIAFAACLVMSRQRWQDDQAALRQEAYERRRATRERLYEEQARFNGGRRMRGSHEQQRSERRHRETLSLPVDGKLERAQIKAAYRRLAQRAHPDVGGSHEQFLRITEARNALLEQIS